MICGETDYAAHSNRCISFDFGIFDYDNAVTFLSYSVPFLVVRKFILVLIVYELFNDVCVFYFIAEKI